MGQRQLRATGRNPASIRCRTAQRSPYPPTAWFRLVMTGTLLADEDTRRPRHDGLWTTEGVVDERTIMPRMCY
ncbi:hypothetical protein GCM10029963_30300 [Micromonospora andamanensis]